MSRLASKSRFLALFSCCFFAAAAFAVNAPSNLVATATSNSSITLTWTDNSPDEIGFTFMFDTNSAFTNPSYVWTGGANVTSYVHSGRSTATTYYYRIKAEGSSDPLDSGWTTTASATTTPPAAEAISPRVFGINAWMPYQIGAHIYYGSLDNHWNNIGASGAKSMRYGGNGVDHYADPSWVDPNDANKSTLKQYLALVNSMQAQGIEPILQVPVYGTTYDASDAAAIVQYVNVTHGENVKYWIIGNEPDLQGGGYGYTTAAQVASYFKPIASAMKAVDPTIKIIGPETAWYNETIINGLTTCGGASDITGTDSNGRYYVDIISFHLYGFDGTQNHDDVVGNLMAAGGFNDDLVQLKARIANCNSYWNRTGTNALKMAVTEANVNYTNSGTDSLTGAGAISFVGGQWWAEALGIAMKHGVDIMTFWSTIEGNQLGYISSDGTTKRPSWYHFQMTAQNFRGNAVTASDNQSVAKTFAAKASDQTAVLIMNQSKTTSFPYTVRLDIASIAGSSTLKVNVDAGLAVESSGTISTESSLVLIFDASGVLKKKIEYTRSNHAGPNLPPSVTTYP
ncbi:MAG TPA: hypothetical protein VEO54_00550 [Thermoanaerobaculia bacterium]|nr:hypothetical protein [Thermoanaerobaculia bacterium]